MNNSKIKIMFRISFVAFLLIGTLKTNAQKIEFGVRLMPTFSKFDLQNSSGNSENGKITLGYGAGAFLGLNLTNHLGIQGEIIYNSISQKYKEQDVERKINLRYFNIPLLISLNTGKLNPVNLNIVAGPQIGISAGSSVTTSGNNNTDNTAVLEVKKGDLGFAYGAGLDFGINQSHTVRMGIGYRAVMGLVDIRDNSNTTQTNSYVVLGKTKINTYSAYIGLSIIF